MKPKYTPLNKLTDKLKDYKCKVKVIQKGPPRQTPPKNRYQRLTLRDDEGNTMQAAIFGDDIEMFRDTIQRNGEYEIGNAPVRVVPALYRPQAGEYQMNFNGRMHIKPLDLSACYVEPQYRSLSLVPRTYSTDDELIDILGVVLFVSEVRTITRNSGESSVRDIFLVDDSVQRPMKLAAWNLFALNDAESLASWSDGFIVVGFTGIRPVTINGLSLSTALSTTFISSPTGQKADALRVWVNENTHQLQRWQEKCIHLNTEKPTKTLTPVSIVETKRASILWQEERFWIKACLENISPRDVYSYVGYNVCARRVPSDIGDTLTCPHCNTHEAMAVARITLRTTVADLTGSVPVTAFGEQAEQMLGLQSVDVHKMKLNEANGRLQAKLSAIKQLFQLIHISPAHTLSLSNTLKWVVREVEPVPIQPLEEASQESQENSANAEDEYSQGVSSTPPTDVDESLAKVESVAHQSTYTQKYPATSASHIVKESGDLCDGDFVIV